MASKGEIAATLNNGVKMPIVGLGLASDDTINAKGSQPDHHIQAAVLTALQAGYRTFDTASLYFSERSLGKSMRKSMEEGLIVREDVFVTSKLWCADCHPESVIPALTKSLEEMQLEYIDLYLIHWPVSLKKGTVYPHIEPDDVLPMDFKSVYTLCSTKSCYPRDCPQARQDSCSGGITLGSRVEQGVSVMSRSFNSSRIFDNFQVFDWKLDEEDHEKISRIEQRKAFEGKVFVNPINGPFRSVEEFWDGEV
eukprot:Gb_03204 [translate_table: standard]